MWCTLQDLRRSNFTAADCRDCNFKNTKLQGTYFIKTVVARANFEVGCGTHSPLACICTALGLAHSRSRLHVTMECLYPHEAYFCAECGPLRCAHGPCCAQ